MSYDMLFSPMKIGNVEIKNRIVMAPMCMGFGQYNGCATETMMDYYEDRKVTECTLSPTSSPLIRISLKSST